jgi:hypothetical protein
MNFLEKDLESIIYEAPKSAISKSGLPFYGKVFRQLRIGNYGIADLVTVHRSLIFSDHLIIRIYELKKDKIYANALWQSIRYAKGITRFFEKRGIKESEDYTFQIELFLVGSEIDDCHDFIYLPDLMPYTEFDRKTGLCSIRFFTYKYAFDGLKFNEVNDYKLINENL